MKKVKVGERTFLLPFIDEIEMHAEDDAALGASIEKAKKVRESVVCWKEKKADDSDTVIDGAHRIIWAGKHGLAKVPVRYESCEDEEEARELCRELNDDRRQQERDKITRHRAERVARVIAARQEGESLRVIAENEGVAVSQVQRDLEEGSTVPGGGTVEPPDGIVVGKDKKKRKGKGPKAPPILCSKCTRVGAVKDCPQCKEARKTKKAADAKAKKEAKAAARAARKPVATDAWGIPIQEHAADAFKSVPDFKELIATVRQAQKLFNEVAASGGGKFLTLPSVSSFRRKRKGEEDIDRFVHPGLETALKQIQDAMPTHTVCPYQYAETDHPKKCETCLNLNWTPALDKSIPTKCVQRAKEAHGVK